MKCPMLKVYHKNHPKQTTIEEFQDCIGKECAWWVEDRKTCTVRGETVGEYPQRIVGPSNFGSHFSEV